MWSMAGRVRYTPIATKPPRASRARRNLILGSARRELPTGCGVSWEFPIARLETAGFQAHFSSQSEAVVAVKALKNTRVPGAFCRGAAPGPRTVSQRYGC